jgi:RNA polymerase sigma factor (sigma-70 family)
MKTSADALLLQQAAIQASLLVRRGAFVADDWPDLNQEILLDLLRRIPKFDRSRGEWQAFARTIARNHATVLAARNRHRRSEVSLDELQRVRGESLDLADPRQPEMMKGLLFALDTQRVIAGLPPNLRALALLLGNMPITEVCARMGKSRSRVHQMTCQLRDEFVRAGFQPHRSDKWKRPSKNLETRS